MLYFTVRRRRTPVRWKVSAWMQLYLGFREIPEASVWERLDADQQAALIQALSRLIVKMSKQEPKRENHNDGHQ